VGRAPLRCAGTAALAPTGTVPPEDNPPGPEVRGEQEPAEQEGGGWRGNTAKSPRVLTFSREPLPGGVVPQGAGLHRGTWRGDSRSASPVLRLPRAPRNARDVKAGPSAHRPPAGLAWAGGSFSHPDRSEGKEVQRAHVDGFLLPSPGLSEDD